MRLERLLSAQERLRCCENCCSLMAHYPATSLIIDFINNQSGRAIGFLREWEETLPFQWFTSPARFTPEIRM